MIVKTEKAIKQSRSTTEAANFHSLQMASSSSWSLNRFAMYLTSSKILAKSESPSEGWPLCSRFSSSVGEQVILPQITPESVVGVQWTPSSPRNPMYSIFPLLDCCPLTVFISTLDRLHRRCLCWQAGRTLSSPGLFILRNQAHQLRRMILVWKKIFENKHLFTQPLCLGTYWYFCSLGDCLVHGVCLVCTEVLKNGARVSQLINLPITEAVFLF